MVASPLSAVTSPAVPPVMATESAVTVPVISVPVMVAAPSVTSTLPETVPPVRVAAVSAFTLPLTVASLVLTVAPSSVPVWAFSTETVPLAVTSPTSAPPSMVASPLSAVTSPAVPPVMATESAVTVPVISVPVMVAAPSVTSTLPETVPPVRVAAVSAFTLPLTVASLVLTVAPSSVPVWAFSTDTAPSAVTSPVEESETDTSVPLTAPEMVDLSVMVTAPEEVIPLPIEEPLMLAEVTTLSAVRPP